MIGVDHSAPRHIGSLAGGGCSAYLLLVDNNSGGTPPRSRLIFYAPLAPDSSPLSAIRSSYVSRLPTMLATIACI